MQASRKAPCPGEEQTAGATGGTQMASEARRALCDLLLRQTAPVQAPLLTMMATFRAFRVAGLTGWWWT